MEKHSPMRKEVIIFHFSGLPEFKVWWKRFQELTTLDERITLSPPLVAKGRTQKASAALRAFIINYVKNNNYKLEQKNKQIEDGKDTNLDKDEQAISM